MPQSAAADPQLAFIFRRPFDEQVAFFRGKLGNLVPTERWDDIWKSAHDRAFMVAGAAKADLAGAVDKAIADGETFEAFKKRFEDIVKNTAGQAGRARRRTQAAPGAPASSIRRIFPPATPPGGSRSSRTPGSGTGFIATPRTNTRVSSIWPGMG
jgi:hypothetical protein